MIDVYRNDCCSESPFRDRQFVLIVQIMQCKYELIRVSHRYRNISDELSVSTFIHSLFVSPYDTSRPAPRTPRWPAGTTKPARTAIRRGRVVGRPRESGETSGKL